MANTEQTTKAEQTKTEEVETTLLYLKAPNDWFARLDRWIEQEQKRRQMTLRPSRPAAIRYIVHQFLLKQEQKTKQPPRTPKRKRR